MNEPTIPVEAHLEQLLVLREEAIEHHQRRMVVAAGDLVWCSNLANNLVAHLEQAGLVAPLWIAREWPEPPNRLQQVIGGESPLLIFNAHHGFDPNLFGAATGAVTGGGLILLLTPDLEKWKRKSDPVSSRITVYPHLPESISKHYIERLIRTIEAGERESLLTTIQQRAPQVEPLSRTPQQIMAPGAASIGGSAEQQRAVEAILHTASGHRHRPLVITADRGRGKSAALGIAAGHLIREGRGHIVVTAPSRSAVDNLFKHAGLPDKNIAAQTPSLEFIPPDTLINRPTKADLVLVDEAAAIPTPILTQIVKSYARVIFATTTHGYEGSGQGFTLRFQKILSHLCPNYAEIKLKAPIRWAAGDPAEEQVNRMLLLDAEPALPKRVELIGSIQIDRIERIDQQQLAKNEHQLRQLYGLLVLAHYRTTPLDLRQLLDGPNLSIYTVASRGAIIATALIADEGEFDEELTHEIWLGRRRPHGHLLPQTLTAHLGIRDAAPLRYRRIIRIAVHPELQRRGVGRELMDKITADATTEQIDLLGTSYGATTELLHFWNNNHLTPLFIGSHRNASSGTYALTQMRAISPRSIPILELAESRFQNGLVDQLREPLEQIESDIVRLLLKPRPSRLNQHDWDDIDTFILGNRRYETVITPLTQLLLNHFDKVGGLTSLHQQLLILKLLQKRPWSHCIALFNIAGKASILAEMRSAIAALKNYI